VGSRLEDRKAVPKRKRGAKSSAKIGKITTNGEPSTKKKGDSVKKKQHYVLGASSGAARRNGGEEGVKKNCLRLLCVKSLADEGGQGLEKGGNLPYKIKTRNEETRKPPNSWKKE